MRQREFSEDQVNTAIKKLKEAGQIYGGAYAQGPGMQLFHIIDGNAVDDEHLIQMADSL